MKVVALGVHVVDVLVRPVQEIPAGQGGALVEEIAITAAGPAGGTAVTLAKLGAEVACAGAIGRDPLGEVLVSLLERFGDRRVAADRPRRSPDIGQRPADPPRRFAAGLSRHRAPTPPTAPTTLPGRRSPPPTTSISARPSSWEGCRPPEILAHAREHGVVTSADLLAPGDQAAAILDWIAPALPHLDYLLPNDEQVLGLTGTTDLAEGCRALLGRGVGCVAATRGAEGALVVDGDGVHAVPAFAIEPVDTTGCGDAFSAGFLRGLSLERSRADAAVLGCAAAALVATGLGSDHGDFDLAAADAFAAATPTTPPTRSHAIP